jgi:hypothetical protein
VFPNPESGVYLQGSSFAFSAGRAMISGYNLQAPRTLRLGIDRDLQSRFDSLDWPTFLEDTRETTFGEPLRRLKVSYG